MFKRAGILATVVAATYPGIDLSQSSLSGSVARAQERPGASGPAPEKVPSVHPPIPENLFEPESKARSMYEAIERDGRGPGVPNDQVKALFRQLGREPGTEFYRCSEYYKRFTDPGVRAAILNYIHDSPYMKGSMSLLRQALQSPDPGLQAAALRNVAKRADEILQTRSRKVLAGTSGDIGKGSEQWLVSVGELDPDGVFRDRSLPTKFLQSSSREVRVEAIRVTQLFGEKLANLDLLDSIRASESLSPHALGAGCEVRLGTHLSEALIASGGWKDGSEALYPIQMPLLHLMQRIDTRYPGLLDTLSAKGSLPGFINGIGRRLVERRSGVAETVLIDETTKAFVALNDEEASSQFLVENVTTQLGISEPTVIKAPPREGANEERATFERELAADLDNPVSQEHRQKYLERLDSLVVDNFKEQYLKSIRKLVEDSNVWAMVWNLGHGEPQHFWFQEGLPGTLLDNDLHHPLGVSFKEIAHALFYPDAQSEAVSMGGKIDLSQKLLVLSPCLQYDMALNIIGELQRLADRHGVEVVMPNIIASNQRGMYSYSPKAKLFEVPEIENPADPDGPKILSEEEYLITRYSGDELMESLARNSVDRRVTVGDVLREDFKQGRELVARLNDPERLEPFSQIGRHDPAFFFSQGLSIERCVREVLGEIGEKEIPSSEAASEPGGDRGSDLFYELGMAIPPLPDVASMG